MDRIERQWQFVLNHADDVVRAIAERASAEPVLRKLFPYSSMRNLRFSHVVDYPYDPMPFILTDEPGARYELRDLDNRPLLAGNLDEVVVAIARLIEQRGIGG